MTTSDFIVIGGGIAGISAAARLARHASVTVLEREPLLGYHATGRSAAIFIRNYGNATLRALNAASVPFFTAPNDVAECSLLSPRGALLIAQEDEVATLDSYAAGADGLQSLSVQNALDLVPILRGDLIAAALYEQDAQDIDVDRMLQGFVRLTKTGGGRIVTGADVKRLRRESGLWRVHTCDHRYEAPVVINAAGAWADGIAQLAGAAPLGLTPKRRSAALLPAPKGQQIADWPLFASASERWYAKPEAGRLLVSPADEDPVDPHDVWADDLVLAEGLDRYAQAVSTPVTRVETSWAGLRTFAGDGSPVVGFDAFAEGFFWLAGQGGYGVQTAPALADLTNALCIAQPPALTQEVVAAVAPGRFQH